MEKKTYYALDIAKFISAFLVIGIHTAPFLTIDASMHFWITQVFSRIAVPLYFIISGYLFFSKIEKGREWNDRENLEQLKRYIWRIFRIYLIWSIVYLPFSIRLLGSDGYTYQDIIQYIFNFFFLGSYYHLWFLPALILGICIVYGLRKYFSMSVVLGITCSLYIVGMLGNVYPTLLEQIPFCATIFRYYIDVFETTRNGFFFAPIYLALGAYLANVQIPLRYTFRSSCAMLIGSIGLLIIEAILLRHYGFIQELTSMYASLLLVSTSLLLVLLQTPLYYHPIYPYFRTTSLLIYVIHIACIIIGNRLVPSAQTWQMFLMSAALSLLFSSLLYYGSKKLTIIKYLY